MLKDVPEFAMITLFLGYGGICTLQLLQIQKIRWMHFTIYSKLPIFVKLLLSAQILHHDNPLHGQ
ncbi:hypothetical protein AW15_20325 [Aeromonas sp. HZM]|nr:hypothetical protein AW15_20325 [Aeromonas sp. HZM]